VARGLVAHGLTAHADQHGRRSDLDERHRALGFERAHAGGESHRIHHLTHPVRPV
jgi:hypothetical protein